MRRCRVGRTHMCVDHRCIPCADIAFKFPAPRFKNTIWMFAHCAFTDGCSHVGVAACVTYSGMPHLI